MSTFIHSRYWRKLIWAISIILPIIGLVIFINLPSVKAVIQSLTPPKLPKLAINIDEPAVWLNQNWSGKDLDRYHHISQGTQTFYFPLSWFLALEQPKSSPFKIFFGREGTFIDDDYILRFGYIKGKKSVDNPHGLPIGFSTTPLQNVRGIGAKAAVIGLTCAACHTGHLSYAGTEYIIEGGPSTMDAILFEEALAAALGQTALSSRIPVFNGRFERFARLVLKDTFNASNRKRLSEELTAFINEVAKHPDILDVREGFARTDALNRIGNQVFSVNVDRRDNYAPITAPVNFPHIWTSPWFDWVQYDGSIMQPLVRNAGEALGVRAYIDTESPVDEKRFSSSIPMQNLFWLEKFIAGPDPYNNKKFAGLLAPSWPVSFPEIDNTKAAEGKKLYQAYCQACHLPDLKSDEIWSDQYFAPITYYVNGQKKQTPAKTLQLPIIPVEQIGTDPAQSNVLSQRTVNTSHVEGGDEGSLGLNTEVCTQSPTPPDTPWSNSSGKYQYANDNTSRLVNVPLSDGSDISFALALGAIVQQTINTWFDQNYISDQYMKSVYEGERPNCLQAGKGYKARPLDGIWATAPFLHNGSVPTLMDLLLPVEQRPEFVQLGDIKFDAEKVGLYQDPKLKAKKGKLYYKNGFFMLDTKLPGNLNTGHEFSAEYIPGKSYAEQAKGVIGPELSAEERQLLLEYLKTL